MLMRNIFLITYQFYSLSSVCCQWYAFSEIYLFIQIEVIRWLRILFRMNIYKSHHKSTFFDRIKCAYFQDLFSYTTGSGWTFTKCILFEAHTSTFPGNSILLFINSQVELLTNFIYIFIKYKPEVCTFTQICNWKQFLSVLLAFEYLLRRQQLFLENELQI